MAQDGEPSPDFSAVDWIQVGRLSHELSDRHGWLAQAYAEKMAARALTEKDFEAANIWGAVAASQRLRDGTNAPQ